MPTIADVAAAAGVSKATVSRVLSGSPVPIHPSTREKVLATVKELGFRPSSVARSLAVRRTYTVGVLVSDIGNPFYADVIHGIEDAGLPNGYSLFLGNTNFDLERGTSLIDSLIDRRVDGVIILFSRGSDAWLSTLTQHGIPTCVANWDKPLRSPGSVEIEVDFRPGIDAAVEHLLQQGHREFGHISGPMDLHTSHERKTAFLEALARNGVSSRRIHTLAGDFRVEGGREAARQLLTRKARPTALFTANDLMALGAMAEARALGLRIPEDLSVIGLDDIWLAAQMDPPLTTVALPRYEIGFQAMSCLARLLEAPDPFQNEALQIRVTTDLILRKSTAAMTSQRR